MLVGGRWRWRADDWIKARANEKLPSPMSRTLSVDLNGIMGRLCGRAVFLAFLLRLDVELEVIFVVLRSPCVRSLRSATWAACSSFWFAFKRDCCDLRAAFNDLPIGRGGSSRTKYACTPRSTWTCHLILDTFKKLHSILLYLLQATSWYWTNSPTTMVRNMLILNFSRIADQMRCKSSLRNSKCDNETTNLRVMFGLAKRQHIHHGRTSWLSEAPWVFGHSA